METTKAGLLLFVLIHLFVYSTSADPAKQRECTANETFKDSGYDCQTCQTTTVSCIKSSESKCYCLGGYVRIEEGGENCIYYSECVKYPDPRCKQNETFGIYPNCHYCHNYQIALCHRQEEPECVCYPGYVHHEDLGGLCILIKDCPKLPHIPFYCPDDETDMRTGYDCLTCQDVAAGNLTHCPVDVTEQCFCMVNHVRDAVTRKCRNYDECINLNKNK